MEWFTIKLGLLRSRSRLDPEVEGRGLILFAGEGFCIFLKEIKLLSIMEGESLGAVETGKRKRAGKRNCDLKKKHLGP